jgi:putative polyketide hydroxylase
MEIARQWGIDEAVKAAGLPPEEHGYFFRGASLAAPAFERTGGGGLAADAHALSPATWLVISQDALEPVLLEHVRALGRTDVRFEHELVTLTVGDGGARARVLERRSGATLEVRARYVVGADGAYSAVREALGIRLVGQGPLVDNVSILFEASLGSLIADRRSAVYFLSADPTVRPRGFPMSVGNPPPDGVLLTVDNADRWLLVVGLYEGAAGRVADVDPGLATTLIRRAIGVDVPIRVISTMAWSPAARVADHYRVGRGFVAGDAAHEMTPSGAFGLNVGIGDAHNLGWKLGAVLAGWAGPRLLQTYEPERQPAGRFAAEQSHLQFLGARPPRPFGNWGVILGATYRSSAVVPDGTRGPRLADPAVDYVPSARPGGRAPHAAIRRGRRVGSMLDLYGDRPILIAGRSAESWASAGLDAATRTGVPLDVARWGHHFEPVEPDVWERLHTIGDGGALLVRPDGHVAWRTDGPASADGPEFARIVARVFGLRPPAVPNGRTS